MITSQEFIVPGWELKRHDKGMQMWTENGRQFRSMLWLWTNQGSHNVVEILKQQVKSKVRNRKFLATYGIESVENK